jgi:glycosyltransferase involved in cell wall biosynthesis
LLRLIVPLAVEEIFANAGMSVVERSLIRALLETRRVQLRLLSYGNEEQQERLAEACRSLNAGTLLEIVPFNPMDGPEVLDGMDGMMLHGLSPAFFEWLLANGVTRRLPLIQHIHSFYLIDFEIQALSALWTGWHHWPPARWVAPSSCTARRARSLKGFPLAADVTFPSVSVIPHGVYFEEQSRGSRRRGREILQARDREIVILSLNRLSPEKCDYHQLVRAFHELERSAPPVALRLALVGGLAPDDVDYVRQIHANLNELSLSQKTIIIVHLDERDKPDVLAGADLFVSIACNPQESFGVALLEAQAAGLPLIATDWNGYKEVVSPFYHGKLVPTLASNEHAREANWRHLSEACAPDFVVLLELMQRFVADPDLRREAAESGRRHAQTFTWTETTRRLLELWAEVTKAHGSFSAAARFEDTEPWYAKSPVDGMATVYAEPNIALDITSPKVAGLRGLHLPGQLYALLSDEGRRMITVDQWRTASGLAAGSADRLLLEAVRKGVLAIGM